MADDELMAHMAAMAKRWIAEHPIDPARESPEPVETIEEMLADLEQTDMDELLFMAEDSPTVDAIFRRRLVAAIFG